ncbi:hypothetical protein SBBP2_70012 [Burkholderiales bacterium]|nr:hypothetical protein SBBP2_70012 [Burkholderiales bacterium]
MMIGRLAITTSARSRTGDDDSGGAAVASVIKLKYAVSAATKKFIIYACNGAPRSSAKKPL